MTSLTAVDPATTLPVSNTSSTSLLKTDVLGRLRISRERRNALLVEFDRSGVSAAQFAQLAGIKYSTFAQWVQKHRRQRPSRKPAGRSLRLVEAVVDTGTKSPARSNQSLVLQLPGGIRLEIDSSQQAPLVAALVQALAARC